MSQDNLTKWQCPMSLSQTNPVDFEIIQCCLSNLRKGSVALLSLIVKGPTGPNGELLMAAGAPVSGFYFF